MTGTISKALTQRQNSLASLIERQKSEIARALPKHLGPDRLARIATTVMRQTPQLGQADPASFLGALMTCAQLGLEPGPLGHAYLVPFKNSKRNTVEVQFIPGYRGLVELARRSGQVQSVTARVVRDGDTFDYAFGLDPKLEHKPCGEIGDVTHVYAVLKLKDGGIDFDVMTNAEVDAIRKRSKSANNGPWVTDYAEMAKKTVLRRLLKTAPMSVEYQQATAQDESVRTEITFDALDVGTGDEPLEAELVDDPAAELEPAGGPDPGVHHDKGHPGDHPDGPIELTAWSPHCSLCEADTAGKEHYHGHGADEPEESCDYCQREVAWAKAGGQ